jgi:hypothetical protein
MPIEPEACVQALADLLLLQTPHMWSSLLEDIFLGDSWPASGLGLVILSGSG